MDGRGMDFFFKEKKLERGKRGSKGRIVGKFDTEIKIEIGC
jgi:hypothetical protein